VVKKRIANFSLGQFDLYDSENEANVNMSDSQIETLDQIKSAIKDYSDTIKEQVYNILNVIDDSVISIATVFPRYTII
jgi:hypothetical protein